MKAKHTIDIIIEKIELYIYGKLHEQKIYVEFVLTLPSYFLLPTWQLRVFRRHQPS